MKKYFCYFVIALIAGVISMSSCSSEDDAEKREFPPQNISLLFNSWKLVSYGNESKSVSKEAEKFPYILTFDFYGHIYGTAYGNTVWGGFGCSKGSDIRLYLVSTKVDVVGADPDKFFDSHILDVYAYTATEEELRLYYSDDEYFKFRVLNEEENEWWTKRLKDMVK